MPSSSATAERSFSAMKKNKKKRLSSQSLALLHVHSEIEIDMERVIKLFESLKNRKLVYF